MLPSSSSSEELPWSQLQSRRLLLNPPPHHSPSHPPYNQPIPPTTATQQNPSEEPCSPPSNGFDANVVMVLSVLLCALICSLGLNSIIRCALRCSRFVATDSNNNNSSSSQNTQNNTRPATCSRLANTGIKKKALKTFTTISYSPDLKLTGLGAECVICLSEFAPGEKVRLLPKCNHGFHVRCIDKWLNSHSSCPTCRNCLIETCQKIVGCSHASSSQPPLPQPQPQPPPPPPATPLPPPPSQALTQETAINIVALQREDPRRDLSVTLR